MVNRVTKILFSMVVFVVAATWSVAAQTSTTNSFSPYSMYGIGELNTQGALPMRSMGGMGVAWRSTSMSNLLNPAGYSATLRKSFIFNFGAEGMHVINSQNRYDATTGAYAGSVKSSKTLANFHDIALQMPVAKGLGIGFSLTPYSSVGYNMTAIEQDENAWAEVGQVKYNYQGEGDITEVKLGIGWEIFKGFSLGVAGMYYWGDIDRKYTTKMNNIVGDGEILSTIGLDNFSVSNFKFQAGLQYSVINNDKRSLTIGATYDIGGSLRPKVTRETYINDTYATEVYYDDYRSEIRLPMQIAGGIFYQDVKWSAGFDYVYQNWRGKNAKLAPETIVQGVDVSYANTSTYKVGLEYTPNRFDVRRYYNRMSYRVGARYGGYYQSFAGKQMNQYAVTVGIGFPLRFLGASSVDVGFEYGGRGTNATIGGGAVPRIGLVKQHYFKFAIGLSMFGEDYWFVRPKYD